MRLCVVTVRGVSATALFTVSGAAVVSLSPVAEAYRGCWFFDIDLSNASIGSAPAIPRSVVPHTPGTGFSGMCEYDDAATATRALFGELHTSGVQFRLFATGAVP